MGGPGGLAPTYVCVGHVTRDLSAVDWTFGGTALYASLTAQRLGWRVHTVTRMRAEHARHLRRQYPNIQWSVAGSRRTTTFRNVYHDHQRSQTVVELASPIRVRDLEPVTHGARIIHLGPVAREIGPALTRCLPTAALVGLTAQGLVRAITPDGRVVWRAWRPRRVLLDRADVVILSDEDIADDPDSGLRYLREARLGVLTQGPRSIQVFERGSLREFAVRRVPERNPTGTGDVFAAVLLAELSTTGALGHAVELAGAAAAFWISQRGQPEFPTRAILTRPRWAAAAP